MKEDLIIKMVRNIVKNEYMHVQIDLEDKIDNHKLEEYGRAVLEEKRVYDELIDVVPEDKQVLIDDYFKAVREMMAIECEYCFKEGVKTGLSNLQFLNDIPNSHMLL